MIDNEFTRDPRIRALAELVHQLRPEWNRAGVMSALQAAKEKPLPALIRAAIDAATDMSVSTPAVIRHRDGAAWAAPATTKTSSAANPKTDSSWRNPVELGNGEIGIAALRAINQQVRIRQAAEAAARNGNSA